MSYQRKVGGVFPFHYCFVFCSLVRNENIKRPCFYTLQVRKVYRIRVNIVIVLKCDLLELEIQDSHKKPYCGYVSFRFL